MNEKQPEEWEERFDLFFGEAPVDTHKYYHNNQTKNFIKKELKKEYERGEKDTVKRLVDHNLIFEKIRNETIDECIEAILKYTNNARDDIGELLTKLKV